MSDRVCCDVCGAEGRRRRMTWAPDGWFYSEVVDDSGPDGSLNIIVWVCSEKCKQNFWKSGPGRMDPDEVMKA